MLDIVGVVVACALMIGAVDADGIDSVDKEEVIFKKILGDGAVIQVTHSEPVSSPHLNGVRPAKFQPEGGTVWVYSMTARLHPPEGPALTLWALTQVDPKGDGAKVPRADILDIDIEKDSVVTAYLAYGHDIILHRQAIVRDFSRVPAPRSEEYVVPIYWWTLAAIPQSRGPMVGKVGATLSVNEQGRWTALITQPPGSEHERVYIEQEEGRWSFQLVKHESRIRPNAGGQEVQHRLENSGDDAGIQLERKKGSSSTK